MADAIGGILLAAYSVAGRMMMPLFPMILDRRARRGLEERSRRPERFGLASATPPHDRVVWVHAASVGETKSVQPLIRRLTEEGWFVVLTTVTVTGAATAAHKPPPGTVHQFAPVDVKPWVERFLDHWRPSLALFVESEVWPVATDLLARRSIPHLIVNARMSERSFRRWRRFGSVPRRIFGRIDLALSQSDEDAERWRSLGVRRALAVGNLKFDVPPLEVDAAALDAFRRELGNRPLWLAASTHPGEEEMIAIAHGELAKRFPDIVTVIAPRHPARGEEIAGIVGGAGGSFRLRSRKAGLFEGGGVLVADTLGELGLFFRVASAALLGGSLVPHGGHNPIEAVDLNCVVIHGPHIANFASIFAALREAHGSALVSRPDEIAMAVARFLDSAEERQALTSAAARALQPFHGALDRTLVEIAPFLSAQAPGTA